jgi:hypothetical protein
MPRSASISQPHPSSRYRDKIRLRQGRRGPSDLLWCATFFLDGRWQTGKPVSLGTRDFHEAALVAIQKFGQAQNGLETVLRTYTSTEQKPKVAHRFADFAGRAIAKLEVKAHAADALASGKAHNFKQIARRIRCDLIPRWGETDITTLTDAGLNHWVEFDYRVEDRKATIALHGRQPRDATRQRVLVVPSQNTLGNLDRALLFVWQEAVADGVVERRQRPMIDRSLGEDSEPRAFIDAVGVMAVAKVMTNAWVASNEGSHPAIHQEQQGYWRLWSSYAFVEVGPDHHDQPSHPAAPHSDAHWSMSERREHLADRQPIMVIATHPRVPPLPTDLQMRVLLRAVVASGGVVQ